ncbi:MAG: hypothetical protein OXU51_14535 [Candidatus Poribacteria bacterium]|nr:hypothetical protein [Candidatus Poribacteria bacterium]
MNQNGDKNGLRGMIPVYALTLVADCVKSELNEINTLPGASDPEWRIECLSQFQLHLARHRAAYVEAKPEIAALEEKNGHSNFGLDIDVCQLKEEII